LAAASDPYVLAVRLTPRAAGDLIGAWGWDEVGRPYLDVRVRAQPIEGRANAALEASLAKMLGIGASRVSVEKGATQRLKRAHLIGVGPAEIAAAFGSPD
jgi:uncharacterized protein YggU (UPF0235/DUF167 family)